MHRTLSRAAVVICALLLAGVALAQDNSNWTFRIGGGVNPTLGETKGHLDTGGHFAISAGYRLAPHWLLLGEASYYGFPLDPTVLTANDVPGGNARVWAFTLDPEWRIRTHGSTPYLIAGVGYYDRVVQFTQPTTATTFIFDPWFGYAGPVLVPANIVLGSFSSQAFGMNAGAGYEWRLDGFAPVTRLFLEARLHYANTRGRATQMIPITIGLRW